MSEANRRVNGRTGWKESGVLIKKELRNVYRG